MHAYAYFIVYHYCQRNVDDCIFLRYSVCYSIDAETDSMIGNFTEKSSDVTSNSPSVS